MNTLFRLLSDNPISRSVLAFIVVTLLGVTGSALAGGGISVSVGTSSISATATVGGVDGMLLRVGGPGDFFAEARSDGSTVNWSLPGTAPDGSYRYEVNASAGTTSYRATGRFSVNGGQITEQKLRRSESPSSIWQVATAALSDLGETLLDILVPAAHAADLTASSGNPTVFYDDTVDVGNNWELSGGAPFFSLVDVVGGGFVFELDAVPAFGNDLAIFSDTNGDVSFANDAVFVDRDAIRLGVGTITPTSPIHVMKADGTAKILAEETNAAVAARNMFELINNGPVGFNMTNSSIAQTWRFAAQTSGFRVSLDGSGGRELEVGNTGTLAVGPGGASNLFLDATGNLTIAGTLTQSSDRHAKTHITSLDSPEVLSKLTNLPISQWAYKKDPTVNHIGPMAQDFHAAFGLGADDTHLAPGDLAGVAVVGVQALHKMIAVRDTTITQQQTEIAELKQRLAVLEAREARLQALEAAVSKLLADRPAHLVSLEQ